MSLSIHDATCYSRLELYKVTDIQGLFLSKFQVTIFFPLVATAYDFASLLQLL